jgi:hypothetical protein
MLPLLLFDPASPGGTAAATAKAFEAGILFAQTLMGWALLIVAGSIVVLVGTSYYRPAKFGIRLSYLLFLPGWFCLGLSMYHGVQLSRVYLTTLFARSPDIPLLQSTFTNEAYKQIRQMEWGLAFFAVWLLVYLFWWVLAKDFARPVK